MKEVLNVLESLIEPAVVLVLLLVVLIINAWIFKRIKSSASYGNVVKRAISFLILLTGVLAFIIVLPIDRSIKGQILGFLGIIISAGIALSSTTVLGNLIAGIMNNSMNRFRSGDLIEIGNLQGRVVKKSIFHTEIQLEDSNFITIPNLFIASNPVKLTRKSNTVISTSVSLGYDISRVRIENALKSAAIETGLTDPYVYIMSLDDYSVVYKIHGFLEDSSTYFSSSSLLNANVLDKLHEDKIEIVSPTFMNQRNVGETEFIPKRSIIEEDSIIEPSPEDLIFDEAIKSEKLELKKDFLLSVDKKLEELKDTLKDLDDDEAAEKIKSTIKRNKELKKRIQSSIEEQIEREG